MRSIAYNCKKISKPYNMLKYLIIPLSTSSPSICRYSTGKSLGEFGLIPLETLKEGIVFAFKHNLIIQYIWPESALPDDYLDVIAHSNHINIAPALLAGNDDITVVKLTEDADVTDRVVLCSLTSEEFVSNSSKIILWLEKCKRLNILFQDCLSDSISNEAYSMVLSTIVEAISDMYRHNHFVQFNLLTDRLFLTEMNNCNAGTESVTLTPDGKFYICPAFYYEGWESVGDLKDGLKIPNSHLLELEYAPICRICDAYHCTRCVYLNRKATLEMNTPGHKQCVMSHLERNASVNLSDKLADCGIINRNGMFAETECLDPFYKLPRIQLK